MKNTHKKLVVNVDNLLKSKAPLVYTYVACAETQNAYVYIYIKSDCITISADWDPILGSGIPNIDYFCRRLRVFTPYNISGKALADYLQSPTFEQTVRLIDREFHYWSDDGQRKGELTDTGTKLLEAVEDVLDGLPTLTVYFGLEYLENNMAARTDAEGDEYYDFGGEFTLTGSTPLKDIHAYAKSVEAASEDDEFVYGLYEALIERQESLR